MISLELVLDRALLPAGFSERRGEPNVRECPGETPPLLETLAALDLVPAVSLQFLDLPKVFVRAEESFRELFVKAARTAARAAGEGPAAGGAATVAHFGGRGKSFVFEVDESGGEKWIK